VIEQHAGEALILLLFYTVVALVTYSPGGRGGAAKNAVGNTFTVD
jgi:hypothetical protein